MSRRTIVHCGRCKNRTRANQNHGWNVVVHDGQIMGFICPVCRTPEEATEAMRRYVGTERTGVDSHGNDVFLERSQEAITEEAKMYAMQMALWESGTV